MAGTGCRWNANEAGAGLLIFFVRMHVPLRNAILVDPANASVKM